MKPGRIAVVVVAVVVACQIDGSAVVVANNSAVADADWNADADLDWSDGADAVAVDDAMNGDDSVDRKHSDCDRNFLLS